MTSGQMMRLGNYTFAVSTAAYNELVRSSEYRWKEVERVGRAPALQFMGPGADTVKLTGVIFPHYGVLGGRTVGMGQPNQMRAQADRGDPLMLVTGLGSVLGYWCVTAIEEGQTVFMVDGGARKQTFEISMKKYGDDRPGFLGLIRNGIATLAGFLSAVSSVALDVAAAGVTAMLDYGLSNVAASVVSDVITSIPSVAALAPEDLGAVAYALVDRIGMTPSSIGKPADWITMVHAETGYSVVNVAYSIGVLGNLFVVQAGMQPDEAFAVAQAAYRYACANHIAITDLTDGFQWVVANTDDGDFVSRLAAVGVDLAEQFAIAPPGANRTDVVWTQLVAIARLNPAALPVVATNANAVMVAHEFTTNFSSYFRFQREYYGHSLHG